MANFAVREMLTVILEFERLPHFPPLFPTLTIFLSFRRTVVSQEDVCALSRVRVVAYSGATMGRNEGGNEQGLPQIDLGV